MQVQPISNQNNYKIQFRGTVSPEFVQYVNTLRKDCLETLPKHSSNLINNECNNILEKAQKVMKNCFPATSVLSVNTKLSERQDYITYANSIVQKHIPGYIYNAYFINKKETATSADRLLTLHKAIISGHSLAGASVKEYTALYYVVDYIKDSGSSFSSDDLNKDEFLKDSMDLLKFWYDKINLLGSELNAKDWCSLKTQAEYKECMNKIKDINTKPKG